MHAGHARSAQTPKAKLPWGRGRVGRRCQWRGTRMYALRLLPLRGSTGAARRGSLRRASSLGMGPSSPSSIAEAAVPRPSPSSRVFSSEAEADAKEEVGVGGGPDLSSETCVPCHGGKTGAEAVLSNVECAALLLSMVGTPMDDDPVRFKFGRGAQSLTSQFTARNWKSAMQLVSAMGEVMEEQGHHADVHITNYRQVTLEVTTHAVGGRLTRNDFVLAAKLATLEVNLDLFSPKWLEEMRERSKARKEKRAVEQEALDNAHQARLKSDDVWRALAEKNIRKGDVRKGHGVSEAHLPPPGAERPRVEEAQAGEVGDMEAQDLNESQPKLS